MYPEERVAPMRQELVDLGFREWRQADQVEQELPASKGVSLVVVNSVCGCSASTARPGIAMALKLGPQPDHLFTVFAGNDVEAVQAVRSRMGSEPPSSPAVGVFVDGRFQAIIHRKDIQVSDPEEVAALIQGAIAAARAG